MLCYTIPYHMILYHTVTITISLTITIKASELRRYSLKLAIAPIWSSQYGPSRYSEHSHRPRECASKGTG